MKDVRQKYIIFASWTGAAAEAFAKATVNGGGITEASVSAETFGSKVGGVSGTFVFTYDDDTWTYQGTAVTLTQYGITETGTPEDGDTITIVYTAANGGWEALGKDLIHGIILFFVVECINDQQDLGLFGIVLHDQQLDIVLNTHAGLFQRQIMCAFVFQSIQNLKLYFVAVFIFQGNDLTNQVFIHNFVLHIR